MNMPKQKTHRGAAKRFSLTKTGKVKRAKAYRNHIMASKSPKQKRNLRMAGLVDSTEAGKIKQLIPYK
jgi:large subunit ribosomal protein L35